MKNFVKENWYKLMIGSSLFIFSVGFFINSVSPVYSSYSDKNNNSIKVLPNNQKLIQVPVNEDGSVNVKLSEKQMTELKSKPNGTNGYVDNNGYLYFVDNGNIIQMKSKIEYDFDNSYSSSSQMKVISYR
jgi:hypothetical protein